MNYTIDKLISHSNNKYFLVQKIADKARDLKNDDSYTLGYKAINQAINYFADEIEGTEEKEVDQPQQEQIEL